MLKQNNDTRMIIFKVEAFLLLLCAAQGSVHLNNSDIATSTHPASTQRPLTILTDSSSTTGAIRLQRW